MVLVNINRLNQVSVLQRRTGVVRDYTSRSSEHGGGTNNNNNNNYYYYYYTL